MNEPIILKFELQLPLCWRQLRLLYTNQRSIVQMLRVSRGNLGGQWDRSSQSKGVRSHSQDVCVTRIPLEILFLYINPCLLIYVCLIKKPLKISSVKEKLFLLAMNG